MNGSTNTQPADEEREEQTTAPRPQTRREAAPPLFNRELSQIEFYRRVLEEAHDETQPLLERLKFLSIFSENLDEFFMIRVSGLQETVAEGVRDVSPDGLSAEDQLREIRARLLPLVAEHARCLREDILPLLAEKGVTLAPYSSLSLSERLVM